MKLSGYFDHVAFRVRLIEMLMVILLIGALASIAIPHYMNYRGKALEAQCLSNRYYIEMEETARFTEKGKVSLNIDDKYKCPSGGTYVWLVMDPENSEYPKIGCSIHFIGATAVTPEPPVVESPVPVTPDTPVVEPPVPVTPDTPVVEPPPAEKPSPYQSIDSLIEDVGNLSIQKNTKQQLSNVLDAAKGYIEDGKSKQATNSLDTFVDKVNAQKGKTINAGDADILISKAEKIRANL